MLIRHKIENNKIIHLTESEFRPEEFEPEKLSKLTDKGLIEKHAEIHDIWEQRGKRKDDELVINAHLFVMEEMKKRNLEHRPKEELDELTLKEDVLKKSKLKDVIKYWDRDIILKDPLLAITGGTAVSGYGTDNDVWINLQSNEKCPQCSKLLDIIDFRLRSMLPEDKGELMHLIPEPEGKFTNYIPFARLKIEMIPVAERQLIKMAMHEPDPIEAKKIAEEKQLIEEIDGLKDLDEYIAFMKKNYDIDEVEIRRVIK